MRAPGGTVLLNCFGGADSSHLSSSRPAGVTKRSTALGFRRRMKTNWNPFPAGSTITV